MTDPRPAAIADKYFALCDHCVREILTEDEDRGDADSFYIHLCTTCLPIVFAEEEKKYSTHIDAQEATVTALWDFARAIGVKDSDLTIKHVVPALRKIVRAYGFNVADIQ